MIKVERFRLEPGEEALVTFLDDVRVTKNGLKLPAVFFVYEHALRFRDGVEYYICRRDLGRCPLCDVKFPSFAALFTVIDRRSPEAKKLFPARMSLYKALVAFVGKFGSLKYKTFRFFRSDGNDLATGSVFNYVSSTDRSELRALGGDDFLRPFDYKRVVSVGSASEYASIADRYMFEAGGEVRLSRSNEINVPFFEEEDGGDRVKSESEKKRYEDIEVAEDVSDLL